MDIHHWRKCNGISCINYALVSNDQGCNDEPGKKLKNRISQCAYVQMKSFMNPAIEYTLSFSFVVRLNVLFSNELNAEVSDTRLMPLKTCAGYLKNKP